MPSKVTLRSEKELEELYNKPTWNDGYWLEAMDRCNTVSIMLDQLLNKHPAVLRTPNGQKMLEKSIDQVQKLYQTIGLAEHESIIKGEVNGL